MTKRRRRSDESYADYVEHPRYGREPRRTGANPQTDLGGDVFLHWHSPEECRIPDTAIAANPSRQSAATVPVTHYYDVRRTCRDCGRRFLFFAEEQKHWYEELGFKLDADCVRCVPCRRRQHGLARTRQRYEELHHVAERGPDEDLELAECCLELVRAGEFTGRRLERVRALLRGAGDAPAVAARRAELLARLRALERGAG